MRVPRMHAFPKQMFGSTEILSSNSLRVSMGDAPLSPGSDSTPGAPLETRRRESKMGDRATQHDHDGHPQRLIAYPNWAFAYPIWAYNNVIRWTGCSRPGVSGYHWRAPVPATGIPRLLRLGRSGNRSPPVRWRQEDATEGHRTCENILRRLQGPQRQSDALTWPPNLACPTSPGWLNSSRIPWRQRPPSGP